MYFQVELDLPIEVKAGYVGGYFPALYIVVGFIS